MRTRRSFAAATLALTFALTLALTFTLTGCAADRPADRDPAADAAAAEAAVADFFGALEAGDRDALRASVTSDFELVEDTLIMSMDDFIAFIEPFDAQDAELSWALTDHNTEVAGDVAWTRYRNSGHFRVGDQEAHPRWIESAVLLRQPDGGWRIDRLQSTPVHAEPPVPEG